MTKLKPINRLEKDVKEGDLITLHMKKPEGMKAFPEDYEITGYFKRVGRAGSHSAIPSKDTIVLSSSNTEHANVFFAGSIKDSEIKGYEVLRRKKD